MSGGRMHADEVTVDNEVVRALIDSQHPQWSGLPLHRLPTSGTDSAIYRLGPALGVRLPRIHWAVGQIAKESQWLPWLAPQLPVRVPEPVATGEPGEGFPYPWLVFRWVDGTDDLVGTVADWERLAEEVAGFVAALRRVDATAGPTAGTRGLALAGCDDSARVAIASLSGEIDAARALAVWDEAVSADPWPQDPVWVHGDLLPGNVLVLHGTLSGVIDWSPTGVGDPACDVMFAWALPTPARHAFRHALEVDDATWARARGWVVQQAAMFIPYYERTLPTAVAGARRRLHAALSGTS